VVDRLNL